MVLLVTTNPLATSPKLPALKMTNRNFHIYDDFSANLKIIANLKYVKKSLFNSSPRNVNIFGANVREESKKKRGKKVSKQSATTVRL